MANLHVKAWRIIVAGFLVAGLISSAAAAEREMHRTFPVRPGCTLKIDTYRGEITVTESDDSVVQVSIRLEIGGETEEEAETVLRGLQLELTEAQNVVSIFARNPRETRARWVWREDEQVGIFYRITVPRRCDVEVKTPKGNVTIGRLEGRMVAEVDNGTLFFRGVNGSVNAKVGEGDLVISRCTGDVVAQVRHGTIRTGLIGGAADLKNASGSVEVMVAKGELKAAATAGDVTVGFPREIQAGATVTSAGGNIFARIDPAADCEIQAISRWGRVSCDIAAAIPVGEQSKRKLRQRLNRGGALIALRADGGDVTIEASETPLE